MHVSVIHRINDAEAFEQAERQALAAGLPDGFSLPVHAETRDRAMAFCIWEAPSLTAVRELVESVVGPYSQNEYYEVELETGNS